ADQLLLLGVHRDDRLAGLQGGPDLAVDVLELGVAVRVALALDRLAVGLEAVPRLMEQLGDDAMAGGVPHPPELLGQLADALARPPQGRLWVAPGHRVDQPLQIGAECRVGFYGPLAAASWPPDAAGAQVVGGLQLVHPRGDGAPRDPRGAGDPGDASPAD